jgi:hypothetical protein
MADTGAATPITATTGKTATPAASFLLYFMQPPYFPMALGLC